MNRALSILFSLKSLVHVVVWVTGGQTFSLVHLTGMGGVEWWKGESVMTRKEEKGKKEK